MHQRHAGMISISVPMLVKVIIEWRKTRVLLTAINVAVRATGKAVLVFTVAAFLIEILWYLLDPDKNAKRILALVLNDTPEDLVVTDWRSGVNGSKSGNLYMRSGYMSRFMEDMLADERKVQIAGRAQKDSAVPRSEPDLDFVAVGLYFANRHMGLAGSEGVMIFTSLDKSLNVACMFAVPYVGENGVKVAFPPPSSQPSAIYDAMYNSRGVELEVFGPQYWAKSRVNDARGGVVAGISYIGTTKAYGDFIAFRGPDERLRVALRPDGGSWQPETLVPMGIADSPALVSFRNKLYRFHQGSQVPTSFGMTSLTGRNGRVTSRYLALTFPDLPVSRCIRTSCIAFIREAATMANSGSMCSMATTGRATPGSWTLELPDRPLCASTKHRSEKLCSAFVRARVTPGSCSSAFSMGLSGLIIVTD